MDYLKYFGSELFFILTEMSFYLLLGFFFAGLLHLAFPKKKVRKYMGQNNLRSIMNASLLGIPLPLCSCGVIPTGISFFRHGASKSSTVSFLISTPQTGVDSIFVTYSLLGLPFAMIRPVVAFVTGIFGGIAAKKVDGKSESIADSGISNNDDNILSGFFPKLREMFRYSFVEFLQDISNWLIIGLFLAALISVFVPDNFFAENIPNSFVGMIIILAVAIPLYICATASVPVAAALILKGLSPGAALVFLMAGPATNAATITMIGKVLGKRSLFAYLGAIITGAILSGLFIDYFLPREWFMLSEHYGHMNHHHEMLPAWLKTGSAIALAILLVNGYIQKYIGKSDIEDQSRKTTSDHSKIQTIYVGGMTCNHCRANVENSVKSGKGVESVSVDLTTGKVDITGSGINISEIRKGIESIGYTVK